MPPDGVILYDSPFGLAKIIELSVGLMFKLIGIAELPRELVNIARLSFPLGYLFSGGGGVLPHLAFSVQFPPPMAFQAGTIAASSPPEIKSTCPLTPGCVNKVTSECTPSSLSSTGLPPGSVKVIASSRMPPLITDNKVVEPNRLPVALTLTVIGAAPTFAISLLTMIWL